MTTQAFSPQTIRTSSPGPRAWFTMIAAELKMVLRDTAGIIIPLGLPLLIMLMQVMMLSDEITDTGHSVIEVYALPVVFAMVVGMVAMMNMPSFLATYRKTKVLRRLAATPAHPAMVLVAQMVVSLIQVITGIALAYVVAVILSDAGLPDDALVAVLVMLATIAAMYALGMVVASVARTPNASVAIGLVLFFGMGALGGMFVPMENLPDTVQSIGAWMPFGASVEALQSAWIGEAVAWENWASLGGTTVIGGALAAALFRWE
ncbi:MAG: ABC transporter permease [Mycobacteriaceae bacterium]